MELFYQSGFRERLYPNYFVAHPDKEAPILSDYDTEKHGNIRHFVDFFLS